MKKETVLIIEDDNTMLRGLVDNFELEGYRVATAMEGNTGLDLALENTPDLIILDLMLPGINGYEICEYLREHNMEVPIIMLTAKDQEADIILGLKLGADDYVTKPFSIRELLARTGALLRRRRVRKTRVYRFGDCELDATSHSLHRAGNPVKLSPKEYDLLFYLVENAGKALNRETIMNEVWGYESMVTPRSIDRFVTNLRSKIEPDPQNPTLIETIREFGYKFQAAVQEE